MIQYAYEVASNFFQDKIQTGYDSYHLSVSQPEYLEWFEGKISAGKVTVLVNPDNKNESRIYGLLESYLLKSSKGNKSTHCVWTAK